MASVIRFEMGPAGGRCADGKVDVLTPYPTTTGEVTSGATSALATATNAAYVSTRQGLAVSLRNDGGDIWIKFGAAPTASVGGAGCLFVADGERRDFGPLSNGDTFASIDNS